MSKDKEKSMGQLTVLHEVKNQTERASLEDRQKSVNGAVAQIEKQFGKNSIQKFSGSVNIEAPHIETGLISLDKALGIGGFPRGRIIELYGDNAAGKTSMAMLLCANVQKAGGIAAYVDAEHAISPSHVKKIGVNLDELLISQPDDAEQAYEITETLIRSNAIDIVVVDSTSALSPRAEIEGNFGDSVSFDTPIYIRNKIDKYVDIIPICDLHGGGDRPLYKKHKTLEVLTHKGWASILGVVKKENKIKKKLIATRTVDGYVKTTQDHSLLQNGKEISPRELKVFDRIDSIPSVEFNILNELINEELAWLLGFWAAEGSVTKGPKGGRFQVCNTKLEIIEKCKRIADRHFTSKTHIRIRPTKVGIDGSIRKDLYILECTSTPESTMLIDISTSKDGKLKKVPKIILNSTLKIKRAYLNGFHEGDGSGQKTNVKLKSRRYYNNSMPLLAGLQCIYQSLGIKTSIAIGNPKKPEQISLCELLSGKHTRRLNEIVQFYDYYVPEFLFDIETKTGTFVSALGNLVLHNSNMGLQARLLSQALRKLNSAVATSKTLLCFISQTRQKIGLVFGSNVVIGVGNAMKFYASVRMEIQRKEQIKIGEEVIGNKIKCKITKNKMAPPYREAEFDFYFATGFDFEGSALKVGVTTGVIERTGTWFSFEGERIGNGSKNVSIFLRDNPEIFQKILDKIKIAELKPKTELEVDPETGEILT